MKATKKQILEANRFKPAEYNEKNLIDFKQKNLWMHGVEKIKHPETAYNLFVLFCLVAAAWFLRACV